MFRSYSDKILILFLSLCAALAALSTLFIFGFLLKESLPALNSIPFSRFFSSEGWYPSEGKFALLPMVVGSITITFGAVLIAGPLGVLIAMFHHFAAPAWMTTITRRTLEALAAIPSVIYGFWGLLVLVPLIDKIESPGQSSLAGAILISAMILPTVALIVDSNLTSIARELKVSAAALGFSDTTTALKIVLPRLRPGLIAALTLAVGRAIGETMAVLMVAGNIPEIPSSIFQPVRTITANIALEMAYATSTHRSSLFVSGLFLLAVTTILALLANRRERRIA